MKRSFLLILIPVAALVIYFGFRKNEPPAVPVVRPLREVLTSQITSNGKVEPVDWQAVRVDHPGLITKVFVTEGQTVERGAPLAALAIPGVAEELASADARAAAARAELQGLRSGGRSADLAEIESSLNRANFNREQAQKEYEALQRLQQKQAATPFEVEAARLRVESARLEAHSLQERRARLVGSSDVNAAVARLREGEASVQLAREHMSQSRVAAPIGGSVYSLPARAGLYLNAGDLVANIGNLQRLRVKVYVDEPELGRIEEGQPVRINWTGLPGRLWTGAVERKPTVVVPLNTRQVGEVWCTIDNPDLSLVPGTNVDAEIQTSVVTNALTIPKNCLRREGASDVVYVVRKELIAVQPVRLGPSNVTRVTVLSGLSPDDDVAVPADRPVKPGERVRPLRAPAAR